jgi:RNA polymerase sigma factor (sigma-70 family)
MAGSLPLPVLTLFHTFNCRLRSPIEMAKKTNLTPELFEALLGWLDSNKEAAGQKYERIRLRLIIFFAGKLFVNAEDLADETLDRVAQKVQEKDFSHQSSVDSYIYSVARYIALESNREKILFDELPTEISVSTADTSANHRQMNFLENCLSQLSPLNRRIFIEYYLIAEKNADSLRQQLADEIGISLTALRVRIYRIRQILMNCVKNCQDDSD